MSENLNITFKIQGSARENGHVTLADFLNQMELLMRTLKRFDALVDDKGKSRVYYRIVNASHNSPLTMELEPVGLEFKGKATPLQRIKEGHHRYFSEMHKIQDGKPPSSDVDNQTLEILKELASPKSKAIASQVIYNSGAHVNLDESFERNLSKMLSSSAFSVGTICGTLDAVNFHEGANKFWIYPSAGAPRIECKFLPGEQDKVRENLRRYVTVYGVKRFRPHCPHPHLIEVRDFWFTAKKDRTGLLDEVRALNQIESKNTEPAEIDLLHDWE